MNCIQRYYTVWLTCIAIWLQKTAACDEGWISENTFCYKLFETPLTWEVARKFCQNNNSKLASLANFSEQHLIRESVLKDVKVQAVWLGASLYSTVWHWVYPYTTMEVKKFFWNPNSSFEKLGTKNSESCLAITQTQGLLAVERCEVKNPFICKAADALRPAEIELAPTTQNASKAVDSNDVGLYAAVVAGCLFALVMASVSIVYLVRRRRKKISSELQDQGHAQSPVVTPTNTHQYGGFAIYEGSIHLYQSIKLPPPGRTSSRNKCAAEETPYGYLTPIDTNF